MIKKPSMIKTTSESSSTDEKGQVLFSVGWPLLKGLTVFEKPTSKFTGMTKNMLKFLFYCL